MTRLWFATALLPGGWSEGVRISAAGGCIESVETGVEPGTEDERHAIGVPGLGNLHSHSFQRGLAGLTESRGPTDDTFWSWRELMYRFVERIDPDELEALAALAFAEMLESGFTHVGEFHYVHHDKEGVPFADPGELAGRIVAAAQETGIGLTLLPTFYAHSGFGSAPPSVRQRRFVCDLDRYARVVESSRKGIERLSGAHLGVAPHSLRAVSAEELAAVIELGRGLPKHLHIAEQAREVEDCVLWSGLRPVEWLMQNAAVDEHWCLVHATHTNTSELDRITAAGAVVALCPLTECSLGDGIFPAPAFAEQHGRFGIGTDSNIRIDVAEELRTLEYAQRLDLQARNVLASGAGKSTGRTLFDTALAGGARALRAPGGLTKGASLDVVGLSAEHLALVERRDDDLLDSWIFCGDHGVVENVWRAGQKVVINGRHVRRDAITARYRRALRTLLS
jgi:formimidoylglutamate deiminase